MNNLTAFFPRHAFAFKGGGGAPTVIAPPVATPPPAVATVDTTTATPTTPPTIMAAAAPAASITSPTVTQAQIDARRAAGKRKGLGSTILSGVPAPANDGGTLGGGSSGKNTLLGGG